MRKRALSFALALVLCLGLLPAAALAAPADLPDWYFLFAAFKNMDADGKDQDGKAVHVKYSMTQEELNVIRDNAREFEEYMNSIGVMRAHVDVVEIDRTVTKLEDYSSGSYVGETQAAPLLADKVDLDRYDHVTCIVSLDNLETGWLGLGGGSFENGTGHSCINIRNREYCLDHFSAEKATGIPGSIWPPAGHVHEFLHFMENMDKKWGAKFSLHNVRINHYMPDGDEGKVCYRDIMLNRARGTAGTGVPSFVWQYPPHVLRTMTELNVPSGATGIGTWAFQDKDKLTKLTIPSGVTNIAYNAFGDCDSLAEVTIQPGLTTIEGWAFGKCPALTKVTIPASVTSIGECAFYSTGLTDVCYGGTEEQWKAIKIDGYNEALTKANIHYNSGAGTQQPAKSETAAPTNDKLTVNGAAADPTVYKIGGNNYFKLRDVAALLNGTEKQFAVGYDNATKSAAVTTGQGYTRQSDDLAGAATGGAQSAAPSNDAISVDGVKIDAQIYKIGGSNYFKLRDLGKALNFYVGWTREQGMFIDTTKPYSE